MSGQGTRPERPPPGAVGAELELRRLTHRRRRLEQVSAALRDRIEHWKRSAEKVPPALRIALRDFERELEDVTQRLGQLNRHDTRDLAVGALDALPSVAVLIYDRDLRFLLAAGGALAEHGWDPERLVGATLHDVMPDDAAATLEPHYRAALAGATERFVHRSVDGTRSYEVEITPLRDDAGGALAGLLVSRDVTAQRDAEAELQEVRETFERLFEDSPVGVALLAPDGALLRANGRFVSETGLAVGAVAELGDLRCVASELADGRRLVQLLPAGR